MTIKEIISAYVKSGYELDYGESIDSKTLDEWVEKSGLDIPINLKNILCDNNGIKTVMKLPTSKEIISCSYLIWDFNRIVERNNEYRKLGFRTNLEELIFFSDNGCGDPFGFKSNDNEGNIWIYYPAEDCLEKVADSFDRWLLDWVSGKLKT
ncbi:SMI1/KNR4 family protein [Fusibacter sp. JL216-2]|uniref:SMI1/KNR4 family protein n=1 Tax=Fusibacter sp. JL216-2 TaxID=3071453 RepID=UPI003D32F365